VTAPSLTTWKSSTGELVSVPLHPKWWGVAGITPERHPTDRVNRMKTTLHTYYFNLDNPKDREPYVRLCAELKSTPGRGRWMNCVSMDRVGHARACTPESIGSREVELKTEHLFDNQWNTASERLFDWYEEIVPHRLIKSGHYLDITDEMRAIRDNTLKCGYTGQMCARPGPEFNLGALGSPHLKENDLHLIRFKPVSFTGNREPLTQAEKDYLVPLYIEAQSRRGKDETRVFVAELHAEFSDTVRLARMKRDGFLWMVERGIRTENCIFYSHTETFSFGWREPISRAVRDKLLEATRGFPFKLEFKTR
jgi:hypothetical protein